MTLLAQARIRTAVACLVFTLILFAAAGTIRWTPGWMYVAVLVGSTMLPLWGPFRLDAGLIEERMSRSKPDAKRWDRIFLMLVAVLTLAEVIVPALDHRFGWTPPLPRWTMWAGLAGVVLGTAGLMWAMRINRFFSAVIRIQRDRGHHVITTGPYRVVRHPGYAFWMVQAAALPFMFGSLWTFVPVGLLIAMFFVRTALEDRVLQKELGGYGEYAQRVPAKLIPGIW